MSSMLKVRRSKPDAVAEELKSLQKGKLPQEKPKINLGDAAALKRVLDDAAISVTILTLHSRPLVLPYKISWCWRLLLIFNEGWALMLMLTASVRQCNHL